MALKRRKEEKCLIRRYLVWCYKTTKEEIDRVDRKFTQLDVDKKIFTELESSSKTLKGVEKKEYLKKLEAFEEYMAQKEASGLSEKFLGRNKKTVKPDYLYLAYRLRAIEKAVISFLGK
ncbi:MAG: hypothetical protein NT079_04970, partial [Candidatus Omnitrophica bacterium]|nr:hypothetical protein [Candidatus Omnitrophota bacterium]